VIDSFFDDGRFQNCLKYHYSDDGRIIETTSYDSTGKAKKEKHRKTFDKHNNLLEDHWIRFDSIKNVKSPERTVNEYEYDNIGNVIKNRTYTIRDGKKELTEMEKKTIVYYK
jgi:hypothetical protein